MLLNNLKIQSFRGISQEIDIDLTAPLTIIYAANGTGKTSICDAVEWTLTGNVKRLQTDDINEVKCRFGTKETYAEVEIIQEINRRSESMSFTRKLQIIDGNTTNNLFCGDKKVRDLDLLNQFVPEITGGRKAYQADWMYSTRFLEGDSLKLLIDDDKDSIDARRLIFSNLFGVREFQDTEKNLLAILNKIPAASTIQKSKKKLEEKISQITNELEKAAQLESMPHYEGARNFLREIIAKIELEKNLADNPDVQSVYEELEVAIVNYSEKIAHKSRVLEDVKNQHREYIENVNKLTILDSNLEQRNAAFLNLNDTVSAKSIAHDKLVEQLIFSQKEITDLKKSQDWLRDAENRYNLLWPVYTSPELVDAQIVSLDTLHSIRADTKNKLEASHKITSLIREAIKLIPEWSSSKSALKGINIEIQSLRESLSKKSDEKSFEEKLSTIKAELESAQRIREATFQELDLILTSGQKFIENHPNTSECPLCEHDHQDSQKLLGRNNSRFVKLSEKTKEEATLLAQQHNLAQQIEQKNQAIKQLLQLEERKKFISEAISSAETLIRNIGILYVDPLENTELNNDLIVLEKNNFEQENSYKSSYDFYSQAIEAGQSLETLKEELNNLIRSSQKEQPNSQLTLLVDLNFFKNHIDLLKAAIQKNLSQKLGNISELEVKIKISSDDYNNSKIKKEIESLSVASSKTEIADIKGKVDLLNEKWKLIYISNQSVYDGSHFISEEKIEALSANFLRKSNVPLEANALLLKAKEHLEKARSVEKAEREKGSQLKTLEEFHFELREQAQLEKYRTSLETQIEIIKEEVKKFISSQMRPLTNIISTLYLRAQGNRFIDSIDAETNKDGVLDWIAKLDEDGEKLENMHNLSQGQRQDLALAIFLARARSLGGTFFLDEPFVHLDDLNRVALLDTLRIIVSEKRTQIPLRLVMTTASNNLVRHLREKFSLVETEDGKPSVKIYKLNGNPKIGLRIEEENVHFPTNLLKLQKEQNQSLT